MRHSSDHNLAAAFLILVLVLVDEPFQGVRGSLHVCLKRAMRAVAVTRGVRQEQLHASIVTEEFENSAAALGGWPFYREQDENHRNFFFFRDYAST
jgi:hypothetical protein